MRIYNATKHQNAQNYLILLVAQVMFILMPVIFFYLRTEWLTSLMLSLVIFISVYIVTDTKFELITGIVLGTLAISSLWLDEGTAGDRFAIEGNVLSMVFFMYAAVKLAQRIGVSTKIDRNTLYAAVSGYLFLGIIGGHIVRLVDLTIPDSFTSSMSDVYTNVYFSFVTISTLGFGDISPTSPPAQAITVILAITGQLYLTIIIAVIISRMMSPDYNKD